MFSSSNSILLLQLAATLVMVGLIWFVQLVHYPLFSQVGREKFQSYEAEHKRRVTWIVAPTMLLELVTAILLLWWRPVAVAPAEIWLGIGLLIAIWGITLCVQVPQHIALSLGYDEQVWQSLVRGNWWRTTAWSARGVLVLWMVAQALQQPA